MADSHPSSSKYLTHTQLLALLVERKADLSVNDLATAIGISPSMLSNILCGYRRADGPKVLKFLGVERVTMYIFKRVSR
jgi:transcriptional regulator with XRE-family HTH domain